MTKNEAVDKIKKHLQRCNKQRSVPVTEKRVAYWWKIINISIFDEFLHQPKAIKIQKYFHNDVYAYCDGSGGNGVTLLFKDTYYTEVLFLTILAHEMIHQWECQVFNKPGHGARFKCWAEHCEKILGLEIKQYVGEHFFNEKE